MAWVLDDSRPIYLQLANKIQSDIISGIYRPGDKLPSVRDLAMDAAVNPNTMQKALMELERGGLIYTQRTSGRYISEDTQKMKSIKESIAREQIQQFLKSMWQLGFEKQEILQFMEETLREDIKWKH
ncbi:MAG: GntR family transcriptional regulator [Lachnospiraceae bacterium]|jgi:GntR family transcriptional regulator|nr:GntR family transcriptional regulator [Lachnospiraceae bacterium]MCI8994734.1 GntR family transcriptional regulator [Lachnospiraceae bacterium]MCI9133657.1 GntR family transcriptional regulator [Lachnospiraceae bacterium]